MIQTSFPDRALIAQQVAAMLLEIKAVHFRPDPPYILTSGLASPVYIDCRKLISYPRIRSACMDFACSVLMRDAGYEAFDAIPGGVANHGARTPVFRATLLAKTGEILIDEDVAVVVQAVTALD